MKKLLFLILLIFLFSCEKEKLCWECLTYQTKDITLTIIYCDKTPDEIKKIEKDNTFYHNLFGVWWHQTTICKLKL